MQFSPHAVDTVSSFLICTDRLAVAFIKPAVARKLQADGRFASVQQLGNRRLIVFSFHRCVGLNLAEMVVVLVLLRLSRQEALHDKYSEPPQFYLFNQRCTSFLIWCKKSINFFSLFYLMCK